MGTHLVVVRTRIAEGGDEPFDRWYDEVHLPEVLSRPGYVAAHRWRMTPEQRPGTPRTHPYLTIYEVEGRAAGDLVGAVGSGGRRSELILDSEVAVYAPTGARA